MICSHHGALHIIYYFYEYYLYISYNKYYLMNTDKERKLKYY